MKIILIITLLVIFTTGCSNSNNTKEKETTTIVQEDKFIKETVSKENILENMTYGDGTSNIKDYETPLEEILSNQSQNNEPITDIPELEIWDCSSFIEVDIPAGTQLHEYNTDDIKNKTLKEILDSKPEAYIFLIKEICKIENIDINELRMLDTRMKFSEDSKYKGYSIQSNKYYINIAYNTADEKVCYQIIEK